MSKTVYLIVPKGTKFTGLGKLGISTLGTYNEYSTPNRATDYCSEVPPKLRHSLKNTISYPLFVHAIRENINGLGYIRTQTINIVCIAWEQTGGNEFIAQ